MSLIDQFQSFSFSRTKRTAFSTDLHKHRTVELFYVLNGIVDCDLYETDADDEKNTVTLTSGQFILILPHCKHRQRIESECEYMMCEFGCTNSKIDATEFLKSELFISRIPGFIKLLSEDRLYLLFNDTTNVSECFSRLLSFFEHEEDSQQDEFRIIEYELLVYDLFFKINKCTQVSVNLHYGNRHLAKAVAYINENYIKDIGVDDIAEYVGVSSVYLQTLFKNIHGHPVFYFVTQNRMKQAEKLLKTTTVSVGKIASRIGYKSLRAFQFAFVKYFGMTPTEFREQSQKYFHVTKVHDAVIYEQHFGEDDIVD